MPPGPDGDGQIAAVGTALGAHVARGAAQALALVVPDRGAAALLLHDGAVAGLLDDRALAAFLDALAAAALDLVDGAATAAELLAARAGAGAGGGAGCWPVRGADAVAAAERSTRGGWLRRAAVARRLVAGRHRRAPAAGPEV